MKGRFGKDRPRKRSVFGIFERYYNHTNMSALAIGGAVAALGSTIYGAIKSKNYNDKMRALIQQQRDDNKRWYESSRAEDYTQRTDAQAVLNKQRELLEEQSRQARATNVVSGGTDQAEALQMAAANKSLSDTMSKIAAQAAQAKDADEQQYRNTDAELTGTQVTQLGQQAAGTAQATSQATSAGLNLMGMGLNGGVTKKDA